MSGIVPTLVGAKKWKPDKEELEKELRKLGIPKEEFKLSKLANEIYLDPCDPVENVTIISYVPTIIVFPIIIISGFHARKGSIISALVTYEQ